MIQVAVLWVVPMISRMAGSAGTTSDCSIEKRPAATARTPKTRRGDAERGDMNDLLSADGPDCPGLGREAKVEVKERGDEACSFCHQERSKVMVLSSTHWARPTLRAHGRCH
jgi:hypothetical protein